MTFQKAVYSTPEIKSCMQSGLRALGANSKKVTLLNTSLCEGSITIDRCLSEKYPQDNRWDYCFSYEGAAFFVEVHSAITSEVGIVINKLNWLKKWLKENAPELDKLKAKDSTPYYWIQASGFNILPQSRQYRAAIQAGIKPISNLKL